MANVDQIIESLEDRSFPPVVLLDGDWGSGKTYFVKNELINLLDEKFQTKSYFFSLYGISSVEDFRDRIISFTFSGNESSTVFSDMAIRFSDGIASNLGEKGVGAILGGAAGAYKYKLYDKLDDCILILDDLERISTPNTIKNILGEYLNLAENRNVKIVVVANEGELSCTSDLEKVFSNKIKISFSKDKIVEIIKSEFGDIIDDDLHNELTFHISALGLSNIRVLKRALTKFKRLHGIIKKDPNVIQNEALSRVLRQIIKICHARLNLGFSSSKIKESIETRFVRDLAAKTDPVDYSIKENQLLKQLDKTFNNELSSLSEKLIDYCCDGLYLFDDVVKDLGLPMQKRLIDRMQSKLQHHELSEKEFSKGVSELQKYIRKPDNLDIVLWFNTCDIYLYLINYKVVTEKDISKSKLIDICQNISPDSFLPETLPKRESWVQFDNPEIRAIYNEVSKGVLRIDTTNKQEGFSLRFEKSWQEVKEEAYHKFNMAPFLQRIGSDVFISALLTWNPKDIYEFSNHMANKYNFLNIEDYLISEFDVICDVTPKVRDMAENNGVGLKTGALIFLHETFRTIVKDMKNRLIEKEGAS